MKKHIFLVLLSTLLLFANAQVQIQEHESFKKDKELYNAFVKFDMTPFVQDHVLFIMDTVERKVGVNDLNDLMRRHIRLPKNSQINKASETNNGYVQTYGIYKNDEAIYYVRLSMNQLSGKLEEVFVERNN